MNWVSLSLKSIAHRKTGFFLAAGSVALSIFLLLAVTQSIKETKQGFLQTISSTDLIAGARGGSLNLLLYSVFHIGSATNNISYESYEAIRDYDSVKWTIPLSLGDSHRGFRLVGTTQDYFRYFRYGNGKALKVKDGKVFDDLYDVVLGSKVAESLGYSLGRKIILTHGIVPDGIQHKDKPFRVSGILKPTGTPVDRALYISLQGFEAMHLDWQSGAPSPIKISAEEARKFELKPRQITAFLIGLKQKRQIFQTQRDINEFSGEPLTAILPGVTLVRFWKTFGDFERLLVGISSIVLVSGLIGVFITLLSTLNERRREIAVFKTLGANRFQIYALFSGESFLIMLLGSVVGMSSLSFFFFAFRDKIADTYGIILPTGVPSLSQWLLVLAILLGGTLSALIPANIAYQRSLQDGLTQKI